MYFLYSRVHIWAINVQEREYKHDGSQWNTSSRSAINDQSTLFLI